MQLIKPGIVMVDTMKNVVIDREAVKEKFGVYPEKMIELQSLVGDSTDNVRACQASDRRPQRSFSTNTATSKRCFPAPRRSSSRSGART